MITLFAIISAVYAGSIASFDDAEIPAGEFFCANDKYYEVEMSESEIIAAFDGVLCFKCNQPGIFCVDGDVSYPFKSMKICALKGKTGEATFPYRIILECETGDIHLQSEDRRTEIEFVLEAKESANDIYAPVLSRDMVLAEAYLSTDKRIVHKFDERAREFISLPGIAESIQDGDVGSVHLFRLTGLSKSYSFGHVIRRGIVCCNVQGVGVVEDIYWPDSYDGMSRKHHGLGLMVSDGEKYLCSFAKYYQYSKSGEECHVAIRYSIFSPSERLVRREALVQGIIHADFDIAKTQLVVKDQEYPSGITVVVANRTLPYQVVGDGQMIEVQQENGTFRKSISKSEIKSGRICSRGVVEWNEIVLRYKGAWIPLKSSLPDVYECSYSIRGRSK